ncbi:MAG: FHA domain-containing protein [Methylococcaceae bacterium]|nr:FHA domain-containing protein [Methylococcaceae bacterium]
MIHRKKSIKTLILVGLSTVALNTHAINIESYNLKKQCWSEYEFDVNTIDREQELKRSHGVVDLNNAPAKTQKAHQSLATVHEFFETVFNWSSVDGRDSKIHLYTNFGMRAGAYCDGLNAFYVGSNQDNFEQIAILYGHPDDPLDLANDIDIVGHEFTHGIYKNTQGVVNALEKNALNESIADMFGVTIVAWLAAGKDISKLSPKAEHFKIGKVLAKIIEQHSPQSLEGGALRNLANPAQQQDLDHYSQIDGVGDIYQIAGITNLAFYLLSEGGKHPQRNDNISINGIGLKKASEIIFYVLKHRLPFNTLPEFAQATKKAAGKRFGKDSSEQQATQQAFAAVGLLDALTVNEETSPPVVEPPQTNVPEIRSADKKTFSGQSLLGVLLALMGSTILYMVYRGQRLATNVAADSTVMNYKATAPQKSAAKADNLALKATISIGTHDFSVTLDRVLLVIGREESSLPVDLLKLFAEDSSISRKHCAISYEAQSDELIIFNYSVNGLLVDGRKIHKDQQRCVVFNRPVLLRLGRTELLISQK